MQILKNDFFSRLTDVLGWRIASIQELHIITAHNAIMQQLQEMIIFTVIHLTLTTQGTALIKH